MMKKNFLKKLFLLVTALIFCIFPVFAAENDQSMLAKILINPVNNDSYSINAYFDKDYRNKAFIEKQAMGEYYIYLPEAALENKNIKIVYSKNSDKKNIQLLLDEKPLLNGDDLSSYVRIIVNMNADYSIRVISKTTADDKFLLIFTGIKNAAGNILLAIIGIILFLAARIAYITRKETKNKSFTSFPSNFTINKTLKYTRKIKQSPLKYTSDNTSTNPLKTADRNSFKCFDIPESQTKSSFNLKNSIEEIVNDKLDIPYADEVIKNVKRPVHHDKDGNEILSMLNIDSNRGFYLSLADDSMLLYGFINDNIIPIKQFKDLTQINLQARFYDSTPEGEVYILRLDSYKSMVEFSNNSIRELVVL